jgi:hypothetical protein
MVRSLRGYPVSLVLRVARLLVGDPDNGTSSSMKSNAASSETEPVELGARSVLFPTIMRQYSSISSSPSGLHVQTPSTNGW